MSIENYNRAIVDCKWLEDRLERNMANAIARSFNSE